MKTKPGVAVWMGGPSGEHEISMMSGRAVVDALREGGYRVVPVIIGRQGEWRVGSSPSCPLAAAFEHLREGVDVVFPALHGPFGEDGTIQGFLETLGLPYVGSGVTASALAMDKVFSRRLAASFGVRVAPAVEGAAPERLVAAALELELPVFVKPACLGSSVAVTRVTDRAALPVAVETALAEGGRAVVEQEVEGTEVSCPVLSDAFANARALPVIEIIPLSHDFFDYEAKYTEGHTDEICPARISAALAARVAELSVQIHEEFGCRSLSRSDFILPAAGEPVFLEVNTMPGLTPVSLFPLAARTAGLTYPELCATLVEGVLGRCS